MENPNADTGGKRMRNASLMRHYDEGKRRGARARNATYVASSTRPRGRKPAKRQDARGAGLATRRRDAGAEAMKIARS
jgi:hypothetical protein